jgi:cytochrome b561
MGSGALCQDLQTTQAPRANIFWVRRLESVGATSMRRAADATIRIYSSTNPLSIGSYRVRPTLIACSLTRRAPTHCPSSQTIVKASQTIEPNSRAKTTHVPLGKALIEDRVGYTHVAMLLHWAIALLIIANIALGLSAALLPTSILSDTGARVVIDTHKSIGITVLGLAILRVLWRLTHRPPPLPSVFPGWEKATAHAAHIALYVLIFALPLSGWMHDSAWSAAASHPMYFFGLLPWPRIGFLMHLDPALKEQLHTQLGTLHTACGYALYVVLALHILGALKHQWIDRHPVLGRMLP